MGESSDMGVFRTVLLSDEPATQDAFGTHSSVAAAIGYLVDSTQEPKYQGAGKTGQ